MTKRKSNNKLKLFLATIGVYVTLVFLRWWLSTTLNENFMFILNGLDISLGLFGVTIIIFIITKTLGIKTLR